MGAKRKSTTGGEPQVAKDELPLGSGLVIAKAKFGQCFHEL